MQDSLEDLDSDQELPVLQVHPRAEYMVVSFSHSARKVFKLTVVIRLSLPLLSPLLSQNMPPPKPFPKIYLPFQRTTLGVS